MTNIVYNMDNMDYMKEQPDNAFELAIVDPPYGIGADKKNSTDKKQSNKSVTQSKYYGCQSWDSVVPDELYFNDLKRVSKNQIIWGVNYYPYAFNGGRIYWKKNVSMPTYSDGEIAYCSLINSIKEFEFTWHGMIQGNMKHQEARIHPVQKPVALYKWLLKNYAKPGDKIFDSHIGSGSIRIACHDMGFDLVGTELDPDYFKAQEERYQRHISQADLFGADEMQSLIFKQS